MDECLSGTALGITDNMEARLQLLVVPQAWTRDEGVCLVILTCSFLYSAELTEKNIKVLIVLERSIRSDQIRSVTQLCLTLWDPMNSSTPGLPAHHQLPEFTQTHVHWVSDVMQPSHPLSSPSPPALNPSQHQSFPMSQLFPRGGRSTGVSALASFLPKKSQGWSPSEWTVWISL